VVVKIAELPEDDQLALDPEMPEKAPANRIGLLLKDLSSEQREALGSTSGVWVEEVQTGPAEQAGIRSGDLILMLDNQAVPDVATFDRLLAAIPSGRSVAVLVQRADGRMFHAIKVP
jgi:serine protease Do